MTDERKRIQRRASIAAVLLGVGMGGFFDGIFLHQILQWHHMLSSLYPPLDMDTMELNMLADGLFHAFDWVVCLVGIFLLWSVARTRISLPGFSWFGGWLLIGAGLFNFVEGLVNHHILGIHTVRYENDVYGADPNMVWALGFLLVGGLGFMLIGWLLVRRDSSAATDEYLQHTES